MIGQSADVPTPAIRREKARRVTAQAGLKTRLYALPLIFAIHQRKPTNRKRQSLKNSGGSPSK